MLLSFDNSYNILLMEKMVFLVLLAACLFLTVNTQVPLAYSSINSSAIWMVSATLLENPVNYRNYSNISQ